MTEYDGKAVVEAFKAYTDGEPFTITQENKGATKTLGLGDNLLMLTFADEIKESSIAFRLTDENKMDLITHLQASLDPPAHEAKWDIWLLDAGPKPLEIIKVLRELTSMGLKEAKDTLDRSKDGGVIIRADANTRVCTEWMARLLDVGAKVEGRPKPPEMVLGPQ